MVEKEPKYNEILESRLRGEIYNFQTTPYQLGFNLNGK
jgi:hypothetical protein